MSKPNFQIKDTNGNSYWISRSIAVVVVPFFHCNGRTFVPLGKRSTSMSLYANYWGIPCGFLDWGESAWEAAQREVVEELGVKLVYCGLEPQPNLVVSKPNPVENETVSLRFVVHCRVGELPCLKPCIAEEVSDVKWLEIYREGWESESLAFNHMEILKWALHEPVGNSVVTSSDKE